MRIILTLLTIITLSACVTYESSIPKGYKGSLASISDTYTNKTHHTAHVFYVEKINNKDTHNAAGSAVGNSFGQGKLVIQGIKRQVATESTQLKIVGQTVFSSPAIALVFNDEYYAIDTELEFTPKQDQYYLVKGVLTPTYQAIWIEDINGNIASPKFEQGSKPVSMSLEQKVINNHTKLDLVNLGESSKMIETRFGRPDKVTTLPGSTFKGTRDRTVYHYDQLGQIIFNAKLEHIRSGTVSQIIPAVGGNAENVAEIKRQMTTNDPKEIRAYARAYYLSDYLYEDGLDVIAEKLTLENNKQSSQNEDTIAWLIKVIGKSSNTKYLTLLEHINQTTNSKKIKKYSDQSIKMLTK